MHFVLSEWKISKFNGVLYFYNVREAHTYYYFSWFSYLFSFKKYYEYNFLFFFRSISLEITIQNFSQGYS